MHQRKYFVFINRANNGSEIAAAINSQKRGFLLRSKAQSDRLFKKPVASLGLVCIRIINILLLMLKSHSIHDKTLTVHKNSCIKDNIYPNTLIISHLPPP